MSSDIPLLKSLGYLRLIETMTSNEAQQARETLDPFLSDFSDVETNRVAVLTYLFGIRQGMHEGCCCCEGNGNYLDGKLQKVYEQGMQRGFQHMALLLGAEIDCTIKRPPDQKTKNE